MGGTTLGARTPSVPIGEIWAEDDRVCCHLCGHWFRSVAVHLRSHGWTRQQYVEAFGLQLSATLECRTTRELRAAALRPRRAQDPAVRAGVAAGYELARSGELTAHAAKAARGRRHPAQRRQATLENLARISPQAKADGIRRSREEQLRATASAVAVLAGFDSLDAMVLEGIRAGGSLASISRAAGQHKDWLQRHLVRIAPTAARELAQGRPSRPETRLAELVRPRGFDDVGEFLIQRHDREQRTVTAIAAELGVSRGRIESAMDRHGVRRRHHVTSRALADDREMAVARRLGVDSLRTYVEGRRAVGAAWRELALECAVPQSWLRRRAAGWAYELREQAQTQA